MRHIYDELPDIPVPEAGKPDGDRVYINKNIGSGKPKKIYIGVYTRKDKGDKGYFQPNDNFLKYFPELWKYHYGSRFLSPPLLECGLYTFTLGLSHMLGLYDIVHSVFGPKYGNALMDFAMYSVKERLNVANLFEPAMEKSVLFSKKRLSDEEFSSIFTENITDEKIDDFRRAWLKVCKQNGLKRVWLAADGSNNNCELKGSELTGKGKAKSGLNITIISYIWAINAENGDPVTFFLEKGGTVDAKAFEDICAFLKANDVEVEGIILDRGFLTDSCLKSLANSEYDFLIMLKDDTYGFTQMYQEKADEIRWNIRYVIGHGGRFGITDGPRSILKNCDVKAYLGLFLDGKNGAERKVALTDKIYDALSDAKKQIESGNKPTIPDQVSKYLKVVEIVEDVPSKGNKADKNDESLNMTKEKVAEATKEISIPAENALETNESETYDKENVPSEDQRESKNKKAPENQKGQDETSPVRETVIRYTIDILDDIADKDLSKKGYSGMACSKNLTAEEMDHVYDTRDASEKQYMVSKSMLGQNVFRGHTDECQKSRALVNFIASIIRNRFQKSSKKHRVKNTLELARLDNNLYLCQGSSGDYILVNKLTKSECEILRDNGIKEADFEIIAGDINERHRASKGQGTVSQYHESPVQIRERLTKAAKRGASKGKESENEPLSHGQHVTSNAQELENNKGETGPETTQADSCPVQKHKGGRPVGSKNKKTLEREAMEKAQGIQREPNHRRGRPPGSKNKKTLEREAKGELLPKKPGVMGRPKGRKDSMPRHRRTKAELEAARNSEV